MKHPFKNLNFEKNAHGWLKQKENDRASDGKSPLKIEYVELI